VNSQRDSAQLPEPDNCEQSRGEQQESGTNKNWIKQQSNKDQKRYLLYLKKLQPAVAQL
jgi:hypothetical protein